MSLTFPIFMGRTKEGGKTAHIDRMEKFSIGVHFDDFYFIKVDEDIDSLIRRAQTNVVEAILVDRGPGHSIGAEYDDLEAAAQKQLEKDDARRFMKARQWAKEVISSGWFDGA